MMQIGMNARLFPANWRPARHEIEFAHANHFAAIQLPGPEQGLDAERLGDPRSRIADELHQAKLTAVMEMVVHIDEHGKTATGASPLDVLHANLPAITSLPCRYVHWHLVPIDDMPEPTARAVERRLIPQFIAAVALAHAHNFHFAFEHNEPSLGLCGTPAACADLLMAVPGLQFVWDFNHTIPEHLAGFLALIPHMSVLHVSDTPLPEVNYHLPLGLGNINFDAYCHALHSGNFHGPAILEIGGLPKSGGYGRDTDAALIDSQQRFSQVSAGLTGAPTMATTIPPAPIITTDTIAAAETVIGLRFDNDERALMLEGLNQRLADYEKLRAIPLANSIAPTLVFEPRLAATAHLQSVQQRPPLVLQTTTAVQCPQDLEALAFYPVTHLAYLIKTRQVTSVALTQMYLARLKRYAPRLQCVVTLTEELALAQAACADAEIERGDYRGPLHGIPWGAKDLLAVRGVPTTWGALPYKDQVFDFDATVVQRLEAAGAVLLGKLTLGSLAWGDVWFGGKTKNPWNLEQGASGSSAGSASATAAGLVGFAMGTETMGSIVSPCARCGITGLRPTYGRVSRHGAMALSWSLDKIGPMARAVEDCALIFDVIHGADGQDMTVVDRPFVWNPNVNLRDVRIGYVEQGFATEHENKAYDDATLATLRSLGATLVPLKLPDYPYKAMMLILYAEAAAAFDELTRTDRDALLARQGKEAWPNSFRMARLLPAVEYIQLNRLRTQLMQAMAKVMASVDLYLQPNVEGSDIAITNFTGHPAVVLPNGCSSTGVPTSAMVWIGQLDGEAQVLAVAKAYQEATDFHRPHPPLEGKTYPPQGALWAPNAGGVA